jgi:predicted RNase H-like HicB family nuclease
MRNYLIIIEKANSNYSAYLPDVPGCVAMAKTIDEVKREIETALQMHLNGLREDGLPIPEPVAVADYVATAL